MGPFNFHHIEDTTFVERMNAVWAAVSGFCVHFQKQPGKFMPLFGIWGSGKAAVRCDGLCSQFAWSLWFINPALWISKNWSDVTWDVHHRKLMGFLGQKWTLTQCDREKGIGVSNGWGVGSPWFPVGKPALAFRACPGPLQALGESFLWVSPASCEKTQSIAYSSVSQEFAASETEVFIYLIQYGRPALTAVPGLPSCLGGAGRAGLRWVGALPIRVLCGYRMLPMLACAVRPEAEW